MEGTRSCAKRGCCTVSSLTCSSLNPTKTRLATGKSFLFLSATLFKLYARAAVSELRYWRSISPIAMTWASLKVAGKLSGASFYFSFLMNAIVFSQALTLPLGRGST